MLLLLFSILSEARNLAARCYLNEQFETMDAFHITHPDKSRRWCGKRRERRSHFITVYRFREFRFAFFATLFFEAFTAFLTTFFALNFIFFAGFFAAFFFTTLFFDAGFAFGFAATCFLFPCAAIKFNALPALNHPI
jgi:hypothetical protein